MFIEYNGVKIRETIKGEVKSRCPVTKEVDYHSYVVEYVPRDKIIEVVKFQEHLESFENKEMTSEDWANTLDEMVREINPVCKNVYVVDNSLGVTLEVEVL